MDELVRLCVLLIIISVLFSIMRRPFSNRGIDPILVFRPIGRFLKKKVRRLFKGSLKQLKSWRRSAWRQAGLTANVAGKMLLYLVWAALFMGGVLLSIPAEIIGAGEK